MSAAPSSPQPVAITNGFLHGCKTASRSVFAFVIAITYIGYGALCHDYGLSVGWAMLSTALVWAGPAQVILVTALGGDTALFETAIAVSLSSVRLLPMVVALLPLVKREDTRPWQLVGPAHYWAVSVWVEAMRLAPAVPREQRIAFCNGIGFVLLSVGVVMTAVGYYLQSALPAVFGAAAMFITPMSFLTSTARNAKLLLDKAALALGLVIAPVLAFNHVEFDLLWTGIIGGTLAYGIHRVQRMRERIAAIIRNIRAMNFAMEPYLALILLGFLPSEVWRWIGILVGRGLDEESEIILWVRAVATALVAAVVARIVLIPPGALAAVPLAVRLCAIACGFLAFYFIRRSAFAGVIVGMAVLVAGALMFGG